MKNPALRLRSRLALPWTGAAVSMLLLACGGESGFERTLWTSASEPLAATLACGDLVRAPGGLWIVDVVAGAIADAAASAPAPCARRLEIRWLEPGKNPSSASVHASFDGDSPSLVARRDGRLVLVASESDPSGATRIVARRGSKDARTWSPPVAVTARPGPYRLTAGRLIETAPGELLFPALQERPAADAHAADSLGTDSLLSRIVVFASDDGGAAWREAGALVHPAASDPALAELPGGHLLMMLRSGTQLLQSVSADGGRSWSAPQPPEFVSGSIPPRAQAPTGRGSAALGPARLALERDASGEAVALAWTDPGPDSTVALPAIGELRLALSEDAGRTWKRMPPLVLRPAREPVAPVLVLQGHRLATLFEERGLRPRLLCMGFDLEALQRAYTPPPAERARGLYALDPAAARRTLRVLAAHTRARPTGPRYERRLFIEGYFMRSFVAAHEALSAVPQEQVDWFDPRQGLQEALDFADSMVVRQDQYGYWSIGYGGVYIADMAVAVNLFPALEPYADAERMARYQQAAQRFVQGLENDRMILPSGALGGGWVNTILSRSKGRASFRPYLVSTALAGIEVHAWLYRRTHDEKYRERALRALEYTLSQLDPDGSLKPGTNEEAPFVLAAYVEEGWMAADVLLQDAGVLTRLRTALPAHVAWLLRTQRPDGTWDSGAVGEFARAPAIIDFLIWYDQRCETRPDVRQAVRRAGAVLLEPERWREAELFRDGHHHEVLRAIWGRPLAAMASEKFVL